MTVIEKRIKEVRQTLQLTQTAFGNAIGVSRDTIANIENSRIDIKDIFIKAICLKFNVDYTWLTTGIGEMFTHTISKPMTQGERIKEVRNSLDLSQDAFAERIGVKGSSISLLESGRRNITEQVIKSICREFNVDYGWLTTGSGEMFVDSDEDFLARVDAILVDENEDRRNMIKTLLYASDEDIEAVSRLVKYFYDLRNDKKEE